MWRITGRALLQFCTPASARLESEYVLSIKDVRAAETLSFTYVQTEAASVSLQARCDTAGAEVKEAWAGMHTSHMSLENTVQRVLMHVHVKLATDAW